MQGVNVTPGASSVVLGHRPVEIEGRTGGHLACCHGATCARSAPLAGGRPGAASERQRSTRPSAVVR